MLTFFFIPATLCHRPRLIKDFYVAPCFLHQKNLGRAVSRILSARVAPRRGSFICCDLTRSPNRFRSRDGPSHGPLFGLAPDGVYRAASLALGAVGSYPTFSPLPRPKPWRYIFCGTFRQPALASGLPECIPGGTGVTRHRVLRCSDFPLPLPSNESDPPPFQGGDRVKGLGGLGKKNGSGR